MRMQIFHLRILMDDVPDVFRDIEITENATFLELHEALLKAFSFSGNEMASFYVSDEDWDKGEEIPLMDMMSDLGSGPMKSMADTRLNEVMDGKGSKMLYLYDFMRMWVFYIEVISVAPAKEGATYPEVILMVGTPPAEDSKKDAGPMKIEHSDDAGMFDSDFDFDDNEGSEPYDDSFDY